MYTGITSGGTKAEPADSSSDSNDSNPVGGSEGDWYVSDLVEESGGDASSIARGVDDLDVDVVRDDGEGGKEAIKDYDSYSANKYGSDSTPSGDSTDSSNDEPESDWQSEIQDLQNTLKSRDEAFSAYQQEVSNRFGSAIDELGAQQQQLFGLFAQQQQEEESQSGGGGSIGLIAVAGAAVVALFALRGGT